MDNKKDMIKKLSEKYDRNIKDYNEEGYFYLPESLSILEKYLGEEDMARYYRFRKFKNTTKEIKYTLANKVSISEIKNLIKTEEDNVFKSYLYYMTQDELLIHIKALLKKKKIAYKQDDYGNVWSINHTGKPIFVAHLDTVNKDDKEFRIELKVGVDAKGSPVVYRPGYVLGADDRAGVNAIINNIEDINFVFCLDEEIGRVGSKELAKVAEFIDDCKNGTFFCQIDRRDVDNIVGYTHGYCNKNLEEEVLKRLKGFKSVKGSYTDIDSFTDIAQGFNISAGYFKAHTDEEWLDYDYFTELSLFIIPEINKIEGFGEIKEKPKSTYTRRSYWDTYDYGYGYGTSYSTGNRWDKCSVCGNETHSTVWRDGKWICRDCEAKTIKFIAKSLEKEKCSICGGNFKKGEVYRTIKLGDKEINVCLNCLGTEVYSGKENK